MPFTQSACVKAPGITRLGGLFKAPLLKALITSVGLLGATLAVAASPAQNTQPTLRALSGAAPIASLEARATALLVIDFQNEYFTGRLPIPNGRQALDNTRQLIEFADRAGIAVVHIQHVAPKNSPIFAEGSQGVLFHPLMQPRPQDRQVRKNTVSVFASTDLDQQLKAAGIDTLIVSGLMTHACVVGAARDAVPLGYTVVVAEDATATRAITLDRGVSVSAEQLHRSALVEIEDTFGDVLTTAQITDLTVR